MIEKEFIDRCNEFAKHEWRNVDKRYIYHKKWADNNRESLREYIRKYSKSEKGRLASKKRDLNRKKRFKEACSGLTQKDFDNIREFYLNCPEGYEVDHIIPIAKGGLHSMGNLQYLTKEENRKKSCRFEGKPLNWKPSTRKKNYKQHKCKICDREFKSVRNYISTCSLKCFNYSNTKKYWKDKEMGLKVDPHNPPPKKRRIMRSSLKVVP